MIEAPCFPLLSFRLSGPIIGHDGLNITSGLTSLVNLIASGKIDSLLIHIHPTIYSTFRPTHVLTLPRLRSHYGYKWPRHQCWPDLLDDLER